MGTELLGDFSKWEVTLQLEPACCLMSLSRIKDDGHTPLHVIHTTYFDHKIGQPFHSKAFQEIC